MRICDARNSGIGIIGSEDVIRGIARRLVVPEVPEVAAGAVVDELVWGVGGDVAEDVLGGVVDELLLELGRGDGLAGGGGGVGGALLWLQGEEVGEEARDVGGGHGGSGERGGGVVGVADVGGEDVESRGEDVDTLAPVGEVCAVVAEGGGADGDGLVRCRGRGVTGVLVLVARGDGEVQPRLHGGVDGEVERGGLAAAEGHVGGGALEPLAGLALGVHPGGILDALEDVGHGPGAVGAEDLDGEEVGVLGDTVVGGGDGAGAVSAVAVAVDVLVVQRDGLAPGGAAAELLVVDVDARVDDVGVDAGTGVVVVQVLVEVAEVEGLAVGDTGEAPGGAVLGVVGEGVHL